MLNVPMMANLEKKLVEIRGQINNLPVTLPFLTLRVGNQDIGVSLSAELKPFDEETNDEQKQL